MISVSIASTNCFNLSADLYLIKVQSISPGDIPQLSGPSVSLLD